MRVIAIDPGYDRLGVAIMELVQGKEKIIFSDCIETDKTKTINERCFEIGTVFTHLLSTYQPDTLAIETIFFNQNKTTVIGVSGVRGMLIYLAQLHQCQVYEFGPQEVKVAITGYGKSDKTAVIDMVTRLVPEAPQKALDDEYDAIAIGVTCLASYGRSL